MKKTIFAIGIVLAFLLYFSWSNAALTTVPWRYDTVTGYVYPYPNVNSSVGIGSTTPWAKLSVNPNGIAGPSFAIGSSSATKFTVANGGNVGIGLTTPASLLNLTGTISQPQWTTRGAALAVEPGTYTDTTSNSGTLSVRAANSFGIPTFAKSIASALTLTDASTLYIAGAPVAGANTSITNAFGLYQAAGNTYLAGSVGIATTTPTGTLSVVGTVGINTPTAPASALEVDTTPTPNTTVNAVYLLNKTTGNLAGTSLRMGYAGNTSSSAGISGYFNNTPVSGVNIGFLLGASQVGTWSSSGLGIGSTTPYARLVSTGATGSTDDLFVIASSTNARYLTVTSAGNMGIGSTSPYSQLAIVAPAATQKPLIVQGAISQTANLQEWQDSNGAVRSKIDANGNLIFSDGFVDGFFWGTTAQAGITFTGSTEGLALVPYSTIYPVLTLKGRSGQTANLQQWSLNGAITDVVTAAGSFGIGTTTPLAQLQVASSSLSTSFKSQLVLTDTGATANLKHWGITSAAGNLGIGPLTDVYATSTYLTITNAGNVGVGTTSPEKLLMVEGNQSGGIMRVQRDFAASTNQIVGTYDITLNETSGTQDLTGPAQTFSIRGSGGTVNVIGDITSVRDGADNSGKLELRSYFAGTPIASLTVRNSAAGVIGIGTTTPYGALNIESGGGNNTFVAMPQFVISDLNGGANLKHYYASSTPSGSIDWGRLTDTAGVFNSTTMTPYFTFGASGNLGVGTTSPVAAFTSVAASTTAGTANNGYSGTINIIAGLENTITKLFQVIDQWGHRITGGDAPTVSGGTSTVAGNDNNGNITVTGTLLTSVTLTFAHAWPTAPDCTMSDSSTGITGAITSISTTQMVVGFSAGINSGTVWYMCSGHQ